MKLKVLLFMVILGISCFSQATMIDFTKITDNDPSGDTGITGSNQLHGVLSDYSNNKVKFLFTNIPKDININLDPCFIAQIYFDDRTDLFTNINSMQFFTAEGVGFSVGSVNPSNLPGANLVSPEFVSDFSVGSNSPSPTWGVNNGDALGVIFELSEGKTFTDVENALIENALRIGLHVQGFNGGYSEGFISGTSKVLVPEPMTLISVGLGSAFLIKKRKKLL